MIPMMMTAPTEAAAAAITTVEEEDATGSPSSSPASPATPSQRHMTGQAEVTLMVPNPTMVPQSSLVTSVVHSGASTSPAHLLPSPSTFSLPSYSTGGGVDGRLEGSRKEMAAVHAAALSASLIAVGSRHTVWRLA